jgi:putative FmdB family regulatory protein
MPTYDYKCNACSHAFEAFQTMSAKVMKTCPKCGKNALKRLIGTGAAVVFKGSGFYQTDYRSEGYKKSADADKKAAEPPATDANVKSKGEIKGESKGDGSSAAPPSTAAPPAPGAAPATSTPAPKPEPKGETPRDSKREPKTKPKS